MKNLRKQHPLLKSFRQQSLQPAASWAGLDPNTRLDLCTQFILLPLLEANKPISQELLEQTLPAAVDLSTQASHLLQEQAMPFISIRDLLEKTTSLFLLGD